MKAVVPGAVDDVFIRKQAVEGLRADQREAEQAERRQQEDNASLFLQKSHQAFRADEVAGEEKRGEGDDAVEGEDVAETGEGTAREVAAGEGHDREEDPGDQDARDAALCAALTRLQTMARLRMFVRQRPMTRKRDADRQYFPTIRVEERNHQIPEEQSEEVPGCAGGMEEVREAGRAAVGGDLREEQNELKQEVEPQRRAPAPPIEVGLRHAGVDVLREEAGDEDEGGHVEGVDHIEEIRDATGRALDREQHVADHHQGDQDAFCVVELQISSLHKTPH